MKDEEEQIENGRNNEFPSADPKEFEMTGYNGIMFDAPQNWTEDYTHENGKYMNICTFCERKFFGHKRRVVCKLCGSKPTEKSEEILQKHLRAHLEAGNNSTAGQRLAILGAMGEYSDLMVRQAIDSFYKELQGREAHLEALHEESQIITGRKAEIKLAIVRIQQILLEKLK